jgi:hypothetical protein
MRTERPEPWGFDVWDPRLTIRQQAAEAQQLSNDDVMDGDDPTVVDESAAEPRELETVSGGANMERR